MNPKDPDEPLSTTPADPTAGPTQWGAPPPPPPTWGPPPGGGAGWSGQPPAMPPPPPPRRDRLALGIVAFIFGGLFLVFFAFLFLAYGAVRGRAPALGTGPRVGVVEVKGGIGMGDTAAGADSHSILKQLRRFAEDDDLKAVVIRIDSPGGSVAPSQEIHDEVKRLAAKKTVVCSLGNLAASGGYYVAVACPKIVAEPGTLTGSIGVISQFPNVKGLAERFNVTVETVKSGKLKDAGNPFRDMTPEDRAYWQGLIDRVYSQFLRAVVEGRKLDEAKVREIADGRVITGEEAKERGLVDALGNFYDAVELAKTQANLTGEPTLVYPPEDKARFVEQLFGRAAGAMADAVAARVAREASAAQDPGIYFLAR
jgi:protease IV